MHIKKRADEAYQWQSQSLPLLGAQQSESGSEEDHTLEMHKSLSLHVLCARPAEAAQTARGFTAPSSGGTAASSPDGSGDASRQQREAAAKPASNHAADSAPGTASHSSLIFISTVRPTVVSCWTCNDSSA